MGYSAKQKKVKVSVEGADKIIKVLKEMEDAAGDVLENGAKAGGKIALEYAKRECPVDTGALRDSLKLSDDKKTKVKATVKVDYDKSIKYGTFVELGARGRKANPFLRNAVDSNLDEINTKIRDTISKAVGGKM
jgi:HK97 gp10 family phage protein